MLKQFPLQLREAVTAARRFDVLNLDILMGEPRYCYNSTVSASFRISLLYAWQRLCQSQRTCTQSKTLVDINLPTVTKKLLFSENRLINE